MSSGFLAQDSWWVRNLSQLSGVEFERESSKRFSIDLPMIKKGKKKKKDRLIFFFILFSIGHKIMGSSLNSIYWWIDSEDRSQSDCGICDRTLVDQF